MTTVIIELADPVAELTMLFARLSLSPVEEVDDMSVDDSENDETFSLNNRYSQDTPEAMQIDGENDMDDMEIDNGDNDEVATHFPSKPTTTTVGVECGTTPMMLDNQDDEDIAESMMETDDMDMDIDTFDDEIDMLDDLFADLKIATPDPDVNEVALKLGNMSISNIVPVWNVHEDPMEIDDPMDLD